MMTASSIAIGLLLFTTQIMTATVTYIDNREPTTTPCVATLGLPTCFPHDGIIDWSVWPGIGWVNQYVPGPHPVSGVRGLFFTSGYGYVNGCIGSIPDPVWNCIGSDTWMSMSDSQYGTMSITFNRPIKGFAFNN